MKVPVLDAAGIEYRRALATLLDGTCGVNGSLVERETGITRQAVLAFMAKPERATATTVAALAWFVWRRLNRHVLLCDSDRAPVEVDASERSNDSTSDTGRRAGDDGHGGTLH